MSHITMKPNESKWLIKLIEAFIKLDDHKFYAVLMFLALVFAIWMLGTRH